MIKLEKIPGGLIFRESEWQFTNTALPLGYEITTEDACYVELSGNVIRLYASDTLLDGNAYPDTTSLIAAMDIPAFPPPEDAGV